MPHALLKAPAGPRAACDAAGRASTSAAPAPGAATVLALASTGPRAAAEELQSRTGIRQPMCPGAAAEREAPRVHTGVAAEASARAVAQ